MKCSICKKDTCIIYSIDDVTLYCVNCWFNSGNKFLPRKNGNISLSKNPNIIVHICDANCRNWGERLVMKCSQGLIKNYLFDTVKQIRVVAEPTMKGDTIDYPFTEYLTDDIQLLLNNSNAILIGGGGTFNFLRRRLIKILPEIHRPLIVYGCGWNRLGFKDDKDDEDRNLKIEEIKGISNIMEQSLLFTVREDSTRQSLGEYGIMVDESPDPAIFANDLFEINESMFDKPYVVVSFGGDFKQGRFEINKIDDNLISKYYASIVKYLLKKYTVVVTQHREQDLFFLDDLSERDKSKLKIITYDELMNNPIEWGISIYANSKMVVASRGHALYLAISFGIPFVAVSDYKKIETIASTYGCGDYACRVNNTILDKYVINCIEELELKYDKIETIIKRYRDKYKDITKEMFDILRERMV